MRVANSNWLRSKSLKDDGTTLPNIVGTQGSMAMQPVTEHQKAYFNQSYAYSSYFQIKRSDEYLQEFRNAIEND